MKQSVSLFLQFTLYDVTCKYNRPSSATVKQIQHVTVLLKIFVFGYEKLVYLQTQGEVIKIGKSHKLAKLRVGWSVSAQNSIF